MHVQRQVMSGLECAAEYSCDYFSMFWLALHKACAKGIMNELPNSQAGSPTSTTIGDRQPMVAFS